MSLYKCVTDVSDAPASVSHNVPGVPDVFRRLIKKPRSGFGGGKCGWSEPWEGA
jgi:hypothetical protein